MILLHVWDQAEQIYDNVDAMLNSFDEMGNEYCEEMRDAAADAMKVRGERFYFAGGEYIVCFSGREGRH